MEFADELEKAITQILSGIPEGLREKVRPKVT